jgi:hypothetical protein
MYVCLQGAAGILSSSGLLQVVYKKQQGYYALQDYYKYVIIYKEKQGYYAQQDYYKYVIIYKEKQGYYAQHYCRYLSLQGAAGILCSTGLLQVS